MGAYTPNSQVWYPDTADTAKLNTLLATMASSIEAGLEPRLAHQEIAVGLKATVADSTFSFTGTMQTMPYQVNTGTGDFNNGFSLAAGVATIVTAGMYIFAASIGASTGTTTGMKIQLFKNATNIAISEVPQNSSIWVSAAGSVVVNCVAGDTLSAKGACSNIGAGTTLNKQTAANFMSIAMVQALPL